jgi:hypothetical protein
MMPPPSVNAAFVSSLPKFSPASTASVQSNKKTLLPLSYEPAPYSVIMGRGRESFNSIGNRRLRVLVDTQLEKYSQATFKQEKSAIVTNIVHSIQEAQGSFVKLENGRWWEVDDYAAREKVGSIIRDCLHCQYKSSTKAKAAQRKARKNGSLIHDGGHVNPSSCSEER